MQETEEAREASAAAFCAEVARLAQQAVQLKEQVTALQQELCSHSEAIARCKV